MEPIIGEPRVSVVISTFNRSDLLGGALQSLLARQFSAPSFELIVVDNNSTDSTRDVVERAAAGDARVRYLFEPQQGSSYGRNAGIRAARAPIIAFTDDDIQAEPDWLAGIARAFDQNPDVDVVGGPVRPIWPSPPPAWLTRDHWGPLALLDYGAVAFHVDPERPVCMVTANCSFRREVFDRVGMFAPEYQLATHGMLGSVEDHELQLRVLGAGGRIFYEPRVVVSAQIQPNRLARSYHRRWHEGHGHFFALLRLAEVERSNVGTLFGVPAHVYRQTFDDLIGWTAATITGRREAAFVRELRLRYLRGFFRTRRREFARRPARERLAELRRLLPTRRRRPIAESAGARVAGHK